MEHVVGANDVGANGLHREELTRRHLLERGSVKDVIDSVHGIAHRLGIAYVADEEAHLGGELGRALLQAVAHVILLLLVATEDTDFSNLGIHKMLQNSRTETARTAGNHESFIVKRIVTHCSRPSTPRIGGLFWCA